MRRITASLLVLPVIVLFPLYSVLSENTPVPKGQCSKIVGISSFSVPSLHVACSKDQDCTLSRDGCRSCLCPIAGNVKYINEINKIDHEIRAQNNDVKVCEACSLAGHAALCLKGLCETMTKE